jgi:hypothetical protein
MSGDAPWNSGTGEHVYLSSAKVGQVQLYRTQRYAFGRPESLKVPQPRPVEAVVRYRYLAIVSLVIGSLALSSPAGAATPSKTKPVSFTVSTDAPATVKIQVPKGSYTTVCFDFQFAESDPLDPGDELLIDYAPPNTLGMGGFTNIGSVPLLSRTSCVIDPNVVAVFNDGHQTVEIVMTIGSAMVTALTVRPS